MNTKAFFPFGGGSNLNLEIATENQILFLKTLATVKFFHQIVKKCHFGIKGKSLHTQIDLYNPYMVLYTIL